MPTPTTNFRLSRETLDALERIAELVRRQRSSPVTLADVVRWLGARHNAKNDPDLSFTYEEALMFPAVYRPLPGAPRLVPPPTETGDPVPKTPEE